MIHGLLRGLRAERGKATLLFAVAMLAAAGSGARAPAAGQSSRPNVIYILLDDVGFSDLGPYGSEISTPNIDQLAAAGLRYNSFDTRAICSPTRAALLTGRNNQSVGMTDLSNFDRGVPHTRGFITPAAATVAQILQANGYNTTAVGKWHLTPSGEASDTARSRANWPSGKGFDDYYGFLGGATDQYHPRLAEGDREIATPNEPGYHLSEAIVSRAIENLREDFGGAPREPSFLYLAFGAAHSPIQVPRPYIDRYAGVYEKGWDRIREERFARQKQLGIIPADAVLPPRNAEDPAWDGLTSAEKTVYARFMATYAGFIEHTDEQIGRLIAFLKQTGQYDNTLIFLMSDNGAAPEAGRTGGFARAYSDTMTVQQMLARLDDLGTERSNALYQRPWAMVGATPFQRYKLWPHAGGVRDPLIVSWPAGIRDPGSIRTQHVDVTDITPTVYDVLGIRLPTEHGGVRQMDLHGKSILPTIRDARAPSPHPRQFYLMRGNRYMLDGDWKAIAIHTNGTPFEQDRWELYNVAQDYTESTDLSTRHPEKLKELQALWNSEAMKYGALPILEHTGAPQAVREHTAPARLQ